MSREDWPFKTTVRSVHCYDWMKQPLLANQMGFHPTFTGSLQTETKKFHFKFSNFYPTIYEWIVRQMTKNYKKNTLLEWIFMGNWTVNHFVDLCYLCMCVWLVICSKTDLGPGATSLSAPVVHMDWKTAKLVHTDNTHTHVPLKRWWWW